MFAVSLGQNGVSFHVFVALLKKFSDSARCGFSKSKGPFYESKQCFWSEIEQYVTMCLYKIGFGLRESLILIDISMSWICLRWFFPFYHGKSLLHHHLGEYFRNFFQALKKQIQDVHWGFFVDVGQFWSQGRVVRDCGVHSEDLDLWGSLRWNAGLLSRQGMDLDGRRGNVCWS